jgi:hypothetical protein
MVAIQDSPGGGWDLKLTRIPNDHGDAMEIAKLVYGGETEVRRYRKHPDHIELVSINPFHGFFKSDFGAELKAAYRRDAGLKDTYSGSSEISPTISPVFVYKARTVPQMQGDRGAIKRCFRRRIQDA